MYEKGVEAQTIMSGAVHASWNFKPQKRNMNRQIAFVREGSSSELSQVLFLTIYNLFDGVVCLYM